MKNKELSCYSSTLWAKDFKLENNLNSTHFISFFIKERDDLGIWVTWLMPYSERPFFHNLRESANCPGLRTKQNKTKNISTMLVNFQVIKKSKVNETVFFFVSCGTGDWAHGRTHAVWALYPWATSPSPVNQTSWLVLFSRRNTHIHSVLNSMAGVKVKKSLESPSSVCFLHFVGSSQTIDVTSLRWKEILVWLHHTFIRHGAGKQRLLTCSMSDWLCFDACGFISEPSTHQEPQRWELCAKSTRCSFCHTRLLFKHFSNKSACLVWFCGRTYL